MDWTLIGNWVLQGIILFVFVLAGVYVALRLNNRQRQLRPAPYDTTPPAIVAAQLPAESPAAQPDAAPARERNLSGDGELSGVRHAFEFSDNGTMLTVLEMPLSALEHESQLVEIWVNTMSWAKVEQRRIMNDMARLMRRQGMTTGMAAPGDTPQALQHQLDGALNNLKLSAERRRHLRRMLEEQMQGDPR